MRITGHDRIPHIKDIIEMANGKAKQTIETDFKEQKDRLAAIFPKAE